MRCRFLVVFSCLVCLAVSSIAAANYNEHPGGFIVAVYPDVDDFGMINGEEGTWGDYGPGAEWYRNASGNAQPWPRPSDTVTFPFQRWRDYHQKYRNEHWSWLDDHDGGMPRIDWDSLKTDGQEDGDPRPAMDWYMTRAAEHVPGGFSQANRFQAKLRVRESLAWGQARYRVCVQDLAVFHDPAPPNSDPTNHTALWVVIEDTVYDPGTYIWQESQDYQYECSEPVTWWWADDLERVVFLKGWNRDSGTFSWRAWIDELRLGGYHDSAYPLP